MTERYRELAEVDAEVLVIAPARMEDATAYVQSRGLPFPCLADPERRTNQRYGVESKATSLGQRPGLFVIDRDGIVRYAHIGWQQWEIPSIDEILAVCLGLRSDAPR